MSKIEIKDLYLVFGNEKQKALKMLKEGKTKSEIFKLILYLSAGLFYFAE